MSSEAQNQIRESELTPELLEAIVRHFAHQLNNPIASIGTAAYLVEDILKPAIEGNAATPDVIGSTMPFVASIREDATTLKQLVDEFRRFFVVPQLLKSEVDLVEFVRIRLAAKTASGLESTFESVDKSFIINADLGLLQSSFDLLLTELLRLGIRRIVASIRDEGDVIQLRLSSPTAPQRDAATFFEILPLSAGQGTGLALPYIRKTFSAMGAQVEAHSDDASHFTIEIRFSTL